VQGHIDSEVHVTVDAYAALGLTPGATEQEIKRAYRKLALERHPDRNPADPEGSGEAIKALNEAYLRLTRPEQFVRPVIVVPPVPHTGPPRPSRWRGIKLERWLAGTLALAALAAIVGFAGGRTSRPDLAAVERAGANEGAVHGLRDGTRRGYRGVFEQARTAAYDEAYGPSFDAAYRKARARTAGGTE
jgi:hypothetical protein